MKNHKLREIKIDSELPLLLDMHGAAQKLSVCYRTLQELVYQRRIDFVKIGRIYKFRPEDINNFINKNYITYLLHKHNEADLFPSLRIIQSALRSSLQCATPARAVGNIRLR